MDRTRMGHCRDHNVPGEGVHYVPSVSVKEPVEVGQSCALHNGQLTGGNARQGKAMVPLWMHLAAAMRPFVRSSVCLFVCPRCGRDIDDEPNRENTRDHGQSAPSSGCADCMRPTA